MTSLVIRFSGHASKFETTHQRLKDIAEYLGVSQNKAVAFSINKAWEHLAEHEDMREELKYKRNGTKVGGIAYLNADEDFIQRVEERIASGVPLPHEDDASIENNLLFQFLDQKQQEAIRTTANPADKRRLMAQFLKETHPNAAADNFQANFSRAEDRQP